MTQISLTSNGCFQRARRRHGAGKGQAEFSLKYSARVGLSGVDPSKSILKTRVLQWDLQKALKWLVLWASGLQGCPKLGISFCLVLRWSVLWQPPCSQVSLLKKHLKIAQTSFQPHGLKLLRTQKHGKPLLSLARKPDLLQKTGKIPTDKNQASKCKGIRVMLCLFMKELL